MCLLTDVFEKTPHIAVVAGASHRAVNDLCRGDSSQLNAKKQPVVTDHEHYTITCASGANHRLTSNPWEGPWCANTVHRVVNLEARRIG
jgi:hypothetical protein